MDSIVKKLSEIESAAAAIVRHAEEQKEVLDHEFREKRNQFDEELEKDDGEDHEIRSELKRQLLHFWMNRAERTMILIALLKQQYEINHKVREGHFKTDYRGSASMGNLLTYSGIVTKIRQMRWKQDF